MRFAHAPSPPPLAPHHRKQDAEGLLQQLSSSSDGGDPQQHRQPAVPHPRWARVNTLKMTVEEALSRLRAERKTAAAEVG